MEKINLIHGDSKEVLPAIPAGTFHACITDPPYELNFMGKSWDRSGIAFDVGLWKEVYRCLKPGAHLLAFGSSRTYHRLACAIEDAGFEIRDQIMWLYGQGFPKSHNLDGEFEGWGSALKPAHEPIVFARKPLDGTIAENMAVHNVGALNIDACRIEFAGDDDLKSATWGRGTDILGGKYVGGFAPTGKTDIEANPKGRWPANVIHDGSEEVINNFPVVTSGKPAGVRKADNNVFGQYGKGMPVTGFGDSGSAARFFYCAKADKKDRDEGLNGFELKEAGIKNSSGRGFSETDPNRKILRRNDHPTVKPTSLMRYLCKLVTPEGGIILDPFAGSGSTGKGAVMEGFGFWGIEKEEHHYDIAGTRVRHAAAKYKPQLSIFLNE